MLEYFEPLPNAFHGWSMAVCWVNEEQPTNTVTGAHTQFPPYISCVNHDSTYVHSASCQQKKLGSDTPVPYFASWHVLHWAQMQSRTHERYNQASEQWLTLQTFIRMFPQTQPCQHFISVTSWNWLYFFLLLMCACRSVSEGVMLAWNKYILDTNDFNACVRSG